MSTQQDIYVAGSESLPHMLNKENYVPWSSRLLWYAKSRPNGKLIHKSIINGPYVRRMIPKPGDANCEVTVTETFHMQTDDELTDKELKQIEADDQAIQTILLGLPEDIYAAVDRNGNHNQIENDNLVAVRAEGNAVGQNGNQIRCYNCWGVEEYDLMAAAADLDEIEEVNANCILMANLQQASTSEEQYTELLEPIPEPLQVPQNDNDVISEAISVEQTIEVEKVNSVNRKLKETNADLTTEIARFKNQTRMTIEPHNWSSSAHQELHKVVKDENFPIVNQVDARVQNFEIQFLKEAAKFVGDFKSLTNKADASLAKHKALELEIKRLLKAVVSQDIIFVVQKESVVDTSDLQTELECMKERFENCIIKKESEYAKLWNDWYKKCDECKYDKISFDKAYKDMQRLQAQLGDLKDTRNPLSQKLENENVELEFQVLNYARENAHLKATYKNLFDSNSVSRTQTKIIIASLQNELQSTIYKNAKLRTQLFKKVSDQKDNTRDTSVNTKFAKQPIMENLPNVGETHALSKPVNSNFVSTLQEPKGVNNDKVIALGMFRINHFKTSREEKHVPNTIRASVRTKPITVSQTPVFTKKDVHSNSNGLSSIGVDNTAKTRRTQPRSSSKNNKVPYVVKSSYKKNKEVDVEESHRILLSSSNKKHVSSKCNNIKLATQNVYSKVVCAMCKQYLISVNHDVCLRNYVNDINSRRKKQNANVSNVANQKKHKAQLWKPKNVGSKEILTSPKPSSPRSCLGGHQPEDFLTLKAK
uniref:Uncharacterized protein n=1 Tax=Tanacetum cinerariifolium TaxID=118510 RepID=A0A6L2JDL5_TANCI|nr:hypothetical protein [Tanacetum cinerariifolium]